MKRRFRAGLLALAASLAVLGGATAHAAILVTNNNDPNALAAAVTAGNTGITVTAVNLIGHTSGPATSTGTYSLVGSNNYNLVHPGIVLSTGDAADYSSGPNATDFNTTEYAADATAEQLALLEQINPGPFFDATSLMITFDVMPNVDQIFFQVVFGSEEFPEFVGFDFEDSFGLFLNGTNIAFVGGLPVDIEHPDFDDIPETELDGVLAPGGNPLLTFSAPVVAGSTGNTLTFIIGDRTDDSYDSTAYISSLGGANPLLPEPSTVLTGGLAAAMSLGYAWRRRRRRA